MFGIKYYEMKNVEKVLLSKRRLLRSLWLCIQLMKQQKIFCYNLVMHQVFSFPNMEAGFYEYLGNLYKYLEQ